jgi:hypothetical protein
MLALPRSRPRKPQCWNDPSPNPLVRTTFWSYTPTAAEIAAFDAKRDRQQRIAAVEQRGDAYIRARAFAARRDRRPAAPLCQAWRQLLLHRASPARYAPTAATHEWSDSTLMDLAWKDCELRGVDPAPLGRAGVVQTILKSGAREFCGIASGHTTSDLVGVLDGVTRTVFLDAYRGAPQTFPAWCRSVTVPDFQRTLVASTIFPALRAVPEHAEFKRAPVSPLTVGEPLRVETAGRVIALTRAAVLATTSCSSVSSRWRSASPPQRPSPTRSMRCSRRIRCWRTARRSSRPRTRTSCRPRR